MTDERGLNSASVVAAFAILDALCQRRGGMRLSALARELSLPKTSALRILSTLCEVGVVRHEAGNHLYWPGPRLLDYGRAQLGLHPDMISAFYEVATPVNTELDETIQLAILTGTEVTFLARLDSTKAVRLITQVGRRLPVHATAAGKAILAFSEPSTVRNMVRPGLSRLTDNTITDPDDFMEVLAKARAQGYAIEVEESSANLSCFAAPVFGADGQVCAGLTLCIPTGSVPTVRGRELIETARSTADQLSKRLSYSASRPSKTGS